MMKPILEKKWIKDPLPPPDWRYKFLIDQKFIGWQQCENSSHCLRRYLSPKLEFVIENYLNFNESFLNIFNELPLHLKNCFLKYYKKTTGVKKLNNVTVVSTLPKLFNLKYLQSLNDDWLQKLVKHVSNYSYFEEIEVALKFKTDFKYVQFFNYIGFMTYANYAVEDIAKNFNLTPRYVKALQKIFFDFSAAPKDKAAASVYFKQLELNGDIDQATYKFYKRIIDLGKTGLKAQLCFTDLDATERTQIEDYLGITLLENTFNLHFSVNSFKEASVYNNVINNLAGFYIKKQQTKFLEARTKNLDALTLRVTAQNDKNSDKIDSVLEESMLLLNELALKENLPQFKSIADLK